MTSLENISFLQFRHSECILLHVFAVSHHCRVDYTRDWLSLASPIALHILTDGDNGLVTSVVLVQHPEFYFSYSFKLSRDSNFSLVLVLITKSQRLTTFLGDFNICLVLVFN